MAVKRGQQTRLKLMRKQTLNKVMFLLLGLMCFGLFILTSKTAYAANPTTINFQGKVVNSDGTNVTDGTYSFIFRIYNTSSPTPTTACSSDSSCLFEETQGSVSVTSGTFQVELGSGCSGGLVASNSCTKSVAGGLNFNSNNALYLTLQFNGDTSGSHGGFMWPVIHLTSVPYAFYADNSGALGGLSASNFVQLAQGLQTDSSTTNASISVNKTNASGTPDILLLQKSGKNTLEVNNSGTLLLGQAGASGLNGTLTFNNGTGSNTVSLSLQADPGSSYTLLLPTTGPSTSQCLQTDSSTANQLKFASCSGSSSYATIQDEGSNLTARTTINFIGNSVSCADNSGSTRTECTVAPTQQNVYDNSAGVTTPEIILNNGGANTGGIDVQNNNTSPITGSLFSINDKAASGLGTSMFKVADTGFISVQPAASLTAGQTHVSQTLTAGQASGTVNGYSQTITVSPSAAATTNGISIALIDATTFTNTTAGVNSTVTDNGASGAKTNKGVSGTAGGSNSSAVNYGGYFSISGGASTSAALFATNGTSTGNIFQLQDGTSTVKNVMTVADEGAVTLANRTNSTAAFQVQNVAGSGIFNIDSSTTTISIGVNFNSIAAPSGLSAVACASSCGAGTLTSATTYFYMIAAIDDQRGGQSPASTETSAAATATHVIDLSWSASSGASKYNVYRATTSTQEVYVGTAIGTTYRDTGSQGSSTTITGALNFQGLASYAPGQPILKGGAKGTGSTNSGSTAKTQDSVIVSGKYAYVGGAGSATACSATPGSAIGCELQVYDVSNPATPTYVGGADASGSTNSGTGNKTFSSLNIVGRYIFVETTNNATACSATPGSAIGCELMVFDIANPTTPTYVGGADASGSTNSGTGSISFTFGAISGRYAYITSSADPTNCSSTAGSAVGCELKVFDISNPIAPKYVGGDDISGTTNTGTGSGNTKAVVVQGRYLYLSKVGDATACSQTAGSAIGCELQVYDLTTPFQPAYVGGADASGSTNSGTGSNTFGKLSVSGRYVYIPALGNATACSQTAGSAIGCELQVYDVAIPATPTYVGGADANGQANNGLGSRDFLSTTINGNFLYTGGLGGVTACTQVAGISRGCEVQVYDVSTPSVPTYRGGTDLGSSNVTTNNVNGLYVSGTTLYLAQDGVSGDCATTNSACEFQIYNIGGIESSAVLAGSLATGTLQVQDTAQFNSQLGVAGMLNVGGATQISGDLSTSGNAVIGSNSNTSNTIDIDAGTGFAGIEIGNTATTHNIQIGSGAAAQTVTVGSQNSSSTLTLQGGSGNINLLTSTGNVVQIGSATTDTNSTLLVLDSYNNSGAAGDPTGVAGGMYYNTFSNTFRCYENGTWHDCLSHHVIELGADVGSTAATTFQTVTGLNFSLTSGVNYRFHAVLIYTASANTIGLRAAVTGPASPTLLGYGTTTGPGSTTGGACGSASCSWTNWQDTYDAGTTSGASIGTTAGNVLVMDGFIKPSANGTLQVDFAPETATANGIVIKAGSTLEWW